MCSPALNSEFQCGYLYVNNQYTLPFILFLVLTYVQRRDYSNISVGVLKSLSDIFKICLAYF